MYALTYTLKPPRLRDALLVLLRDDPKVVATAHTIDFEELSQHLPTNANRAEIFQVFMELYARQRGRPRWGLKSPGSERQAHVILNAFPTARFIHLVRDPRDVASSFINYKEGALGRYNPYMHMAVWRRSVRLAEANSRRFPKRYLIVRHEDVVTRQEETIRTLCNFVNLPYRDEILEMKGHPGWTGHNSSFDRPEAHRETLKLQWGRAYGSLLSDELGRLQYPSTRTVPRRSERFGLMLAEQLLNLASLLRLRLPWPVLRAAASVRRSR